MAEIQRNIIKRGKRNAISQCFHKKNDSKAIAGWRLDLDRILHVFNVRSVTFGWPSLTFSFQTELEINTRATDSDIRHDIANTHPIVPDVHHDISDANDTVPDVRHVVSGTNAIVSDIHRGKLRSSEGTDSQNLAVSASCVFCLSPSNHLPLPRLMPGPRSRL